MTQFALERNPDIHFINTGTFYGPLSVRINEVWLFRLSRFGRGEGSQPTTVVPSHFQLRSYGPENVVHLCAFSLAFCCCCCCFFFFLTPWFRYELLKPEPESKLWHTSRFNVRVWSQICFFILNRFIWLSITGTLPDTTHWFTSEFARSERAGSNINSNLLNWAQFKIAQKHMKLVFFAFLKCPARTSKELTTA